MIKRILTGLAIIVVAIVGYMAWQNGQVPAHVGLKDGKFSPLPSSPNAVSSQTEETERKVAPLPVKGDAAATREAIKQTLNALETSETHAIVTEDDTYMHVVFTTPTVGYHDDVEFLIDTDAGLVHYRSQSRVGYSDRGANRIRYDAFAMAYGK